MHNKFLVFHHSKLSTVLSFTPRFVKKNENLFSLVFPSSLQHSTTFLAKKEKKPFGKKTGIFSFNKNPQERVTLHFCLNKVN
jgi:hypothetical protein